MLMINLSNIDGNEIIKKQYEFRHTVINKKANPQSKNEKFVMFDVLG